MTDKLHDNTQRRVRLPGDGTHAAEVSDAQDAADRNATPRDGRTGTPVVTSSLKCQGCGSHRTAYVLARCSDTCGVQVTGRQHHGYVPRDMGIGGGDDVQFTYCLDCGRMRGTFPLPHTSLEGDGEPTR